MAIQVKRLDWPAEHGTTVSVAVLNKHGELVIKQGFNAEPANTDLPLNFDYEVHLSPENAMDLLQFLQEHMPALIERNEHLKLRAALR